MAGMVQDNLRCCQVVSLAEPVLNLARSTDERRELQILVGEFGEFDASQPALKLVSKGRTLHRPEGLHVALLPHTVERLESRRSELPSGCREVEISVRRRADDLAPTRSKVPVEFLGVAQGQRHHERVADGVPMERRSLPKSARQKHANRPFIDRLEQVGMAQQEHPKVVRYLARR